MLSTLLEGSLIHDLRKGFPGRHATGDVTLEVHKEIHDEVYDVVSFIMRSWLWEVAF